MTFLTKTTLGSLRDQLEAVLRKYDHPGDLSPMTLTLCRDQPFKFCGQDCSTVADDMTLDAYLGLTGDSKDRDVRQQTDDICSLT